MEEVAEVYTLGGYYDLVAILRGGEQNALGEGIVDRLRSVAGVAKAETITSPSIPDIRWRTCSPLVWKAEHALRQAG